MRESAVPASSKFRFAICNELFEGWTFADTCQQAVALGYEGIEIAPFTLAPLITQISQDERKRLKETAQQAGIAIVGLHWLLAKTEGFQITSPDSSIRASTAAYLGELALACADLGGTLMVFGSPAARKIHTGHTHAQAMQFAADTIRQFLPALERAQVEFLLEPLSPAETDFLQTADAAAELADLVNHPLVRLHLDVKAMSSEVDSAQKDTPGWSETIAAVIRKHHTRAGHFHANDPNLRGPGMGKIQFEPIFRALNEVKYNGYVSVEVFDFKPDPVTIARESINYMQQVLARIEEQA